MKRIRKMILILVTVIFTLVMISRVIHDSVPKQMDITSEGTFKNVRKYEPQLREELAKDDLEEYTPVLMALMQQESNGLGDDPMQASESAGLKRNGIHDVSRSIHQGVKHFERVLTYGQQQGVDFPAIIQAYNMGISYINYVKAHGGKHSEDLAKSFSLIQVHKAPKKYDCGGDKKNFRYPYCYGDFTYNAKVEKNIDALQAIVKASNNSGKAS
ncbi:lysozyme-like protein [Scopulibacillus darangshiensis]|uniref:Lysozyme-like protein n=1 Tax=Scopulibacillus darangshiensis TaxID=442528 RepID=A0A4R2NGL2_9BACL|nr:lysozyme family protein [Scopulibacillus darangshiensis]TCP20295.1 lysozyme-like protein [Scopulibacillus darangshiensis]